MNVRGGLSSLVPPVHPCFRRALALTLLFVGAAFVGVASRVEEPPPVVTPPMEIIVEAWGHAPAPPIVFPPREPRLLRDLNDRRPWVRGLSAVLLAQWGRDATAPALEGSLFDAHPWVAAQAARTLSVHLPERSIPALGRALRTGHLCTRREAARTLSAYGANPEARALLDDVARRSSSPWVVRFAREILPPPPPRRFVHRGRTGPCPL